ncbi:putative membrane protein [Agrococcus baldri]|uniref:Membrane protein n=1 Tax=Agrococcus baldri TaxID=153730 RepID=A0AA94HML5_9MICO|nr:YhgE/Pip domain-containing protein [Agrococcus baldri]SFS08357.1 putative membrane protein [Agrococcus baldri]
MKIPQLIAAELRRLVSTPMARLALLALAIVPLLYGGVYLWANQDPYAHLDELPAALVVEDAGFDGENQGDEVADRVIAEATFDWHRVSAAEAAAGVADGTFDFSLTLPATFSADLQSVSGDDPHRATVTLTTNDANSYLASTIGTQATAKFRQSVVAAVGEEAAGRMLLAISDLRDGLLDAEGGAGQLADGLTSALDGATQLTTGTSTASDGATQLQSGTASLVDGTTQLQSGAAQLADGLGTLQQRTANLPAQAQQLADGARRVADGNAQVATLGDRVAGVTGGLAGDVPDARAQILAQLTAAGLDEAQLAAALEPLDALGADIVAGDARVQEANAQLQQLASGSSQLADGAAQLAAATPALTDGIAQASSGASRLADGTAAAHDGALALDDGATRLVAGLGQLGDGAAALRDGVDELRSGAAQLRDGLADGVAQVPASTPALRSDQASTIADPVTTDADAVTSAGTYGAGLAPFFLSLAAWIGMYALMLIIKPLSRRAITALRSPVRVGLAAWLTPALLGVAQMAALFGLIALWLRFDIAWPWATVGLMMLTVVTFAAIIVALNVWLGSVGQFLGLVLMVLQLVTAGGTFPWQTLPAPLAALHHLLPMSYAVDGIRQAMYGGQASIAANDALVLAGFLGIGVLAAIAGVARMMDHRTLRDLQPSLIG